MKAPFFIVGVQRSGTTLLSKMLAQNPEVHMEDQAKAFRLIGTFDNMYEIHKYNSGLPKEDFIRWMLHNDKNDRIREVVDEYLISNEVNVRALIFSSLQQKCKLAGKSIWGDKAPNLQHYIKELLLYIPDAKFIHIVRDGRATVSSMKKRSYRNSVLSADLWVQGNSCGIVNQNILGENRYLFIRYEDLIVNASYELTKVCDFLGISFNKQMLDLSKEGQSGRDNYVKSYLDISKVDAWRSDFQPNELKKLEGLQYDLLKYFGYEVEGQAGEQLSEGRRMWLIFKDRWFSLWRRRKKGINDWQIVEYEDSFKKRFGRFAIAMGNLFLSQRLFKSIFKQFHYKKKIKDR